MSILPYDKANPFSIEAFAKRLQNKSLREVLDDLLNLDLLVKRKGSLGTLIEEFYFLYKPNSIAAPDFPEAGVELKTCPVLPDKTVKFKAKERLVFNIINYEEEHNKEFTESSFWRKNKLLLLMFYIHEKESIDIDLVFKLIQLFRFPGVDLKIIKDDWEKIRLKIQQGLAHEISEGDTIYLGACTKGANKTSLRKQPFSNIPAMQRAYSLKARYLNVIIQKALKGETELLDYTEDYQKILSKDTVADPLTKYSILNKGNLMTPIIKSLEDFNPGQTFEEVVVSKFDNYLNKTVDEIIKTTGKKLNIKAKNFYANLTKTILGIELDKEIEEFEKAEIIVKTIRLKKNDLPKEDISFPTFKFTEIVNDKWESSNFKNILEHKFLFIFFQFTDDGLILKKVKFWNMPYNDILEAAKVWFKTKRVISEGKIVKEVKNNIRYTFFPNKSFNHVAHVRPHALNSKDIFPLPVPDQLTNLTEYTKHCFWLNNHYIKTEIFLKD